MTDHTPTDPDAACRAAWPEATDGAYDPRCCRFPKSCSARPAPIQDARASARSRAGVVQGLLTDVTGTVDAARSVLDRLVEHLDRQTCADGPVPATGWSIDADGAVNVTASTGVVVRVHPDDVAEIAEAYLGARDLIPVELPKTVVGRVNP